MSNYIIECIILSIKTKQQVVFITNFISAEVMEKKDNGFGMKGRIIAGEGKSDSLASTYKRTPSFTSYKLG